jgi:ketosteroid isomerase-like protein
MEQEVIQGEEKFLQAFRDADSGTVAELLHDDMIYNNAVGFVISKKADIEGFAAANPKVESVECLERTVQMFGDVAVVTNITHIKGIFGGHSVDSKVRFLRTWKRFGGEWKIIAVAAVDLA